MSKLIFNLNNVRNRDGQYCDIRDGHYSDIRDKMLDKEREISNKIYRLSGLKNWNKLYNKEEINNIEDWVGGFNNSLGNFYIHKYCNNYKKKFPYKKNEIDIYLLQVELNQLEKESLSLIIKSELSYGINERNCKVKHVSKREARILTNNSCGICFETHNLRNVCMTDCGHVFCKKCIEKMVDGYLWNYKNNYEITCPYCRKNDLQFTIFKNRK